jgi:hypothetical protein
VTTLSSQAILMENIMKATLKRKKKKPYSSYTITTGDPVLNIQHFNKCAGTDGGPITESLDLTDLSQFDISFNDFRTIQSRYIKYLKSAGQLSDQDLICDPEAIVLVNRQRPVYLIKYYVIAKLLH